tara:strand:- start:25872 stop:27107 length:1236 start_codon:yes stop_codon:yes gene_type:complete
MSYELQPKTEAGKKFVTAAMGVTQQLRDNAGESDRSGEVPAASFDEVRRAGISGAFLPEECGGFGMTSIHDWMVGMSRLGRGDGSVAIAMNMHLAVSRGLAGAWRGGMASNNKPMTDQLGQQFDQILAGTMHICATATEPGSDNLHPFTEATKVEEGWLINGLKIFVTGSPIASHIAMNLRVQSSEGDTISSTILPIETKGVVPLDDWQAMGMRGSGSQSIKFDNVLVPNHAVNPVGPWGRWSANMLMNRNLGNLPLLGVFLGIAEHAYELAIASATGTQKKAKPPSAELPGIQHMIGEMEVLLATARAMVGQMGSIADDFVREFEGQKIPFERAHELLKDHQSMKWVVNRNAIEIVNRAMDIVGGGGFMDKHPLSRLYRDVRAGPFMQPYSPTEARAYIGKVALGIYPKA